MIEFQLWAAAIAYVALRSFQQKNSVGSKYLAMIPSSYGMSYLDTFVIVSVADKLTDMAWIWIGTGGWMGAMLGTWVHDRMFTRKGA